MSVRATAAVLLGLLLLAGVCQAELPQAAKVGDVVKVRQPLASGVSPDTANENSWTAQHVAALHGQVAVAQLLLARGATVDVRGGGGGTPLLVAAGAGQVKLARLLLTYRADPNLCTKTLSRPLHAAVHVGNLEVARLLLMARRDTPGEGGTGFRRLWRGTRRGGNLPTGSRSGRERSIPLTKPPLTEVRSTHGWKRSEGPSPDQWSGHRASSPSGITSPRERA